MSKMNTDKTLREKFIYKEEEYPVWYYKELISIDIDYVIMFLLTTDKFIVDIDGMKLEITFGKNRKNEIGNTTKWSDFRYIGMTSYETIQKAFKVGKWYLVSEKDTTDEFKEKFRKEKEQYKQEKLRENYLDILTRAIQMSEYEGLTEQRKRSLIEEINTYDIETLKELFDKLIKKFK